MLQAFVAARTPAAPAIDVRTEAERASSRQIVDTLGRLFAVNQPAGSAASLLAEQPEVADRLAPLLGSKCAGARPVVTDVQFVDPDPDPDPDTANVTFRFEGGAVDPGNIPFSGGFRRVDGRWLAEPDVVNHVADAAVPYCLANS